MSINTKKILLFQILLFGLIFWWALTFTYAWPQVRTLVPDSVKIEDQDSSLVDLHKAILDSKKTLEKYPNSDFTPTIMFQLVELYVRKSRMEFDQEMSNYEEKLKKYDVGLLQKEPTPPKINFQPSIELCQQILQRYPGIDFKDKILYRLAMCQQEEGNREKATNTFRLLILETPQSSLVPEAYFRIGEYYFDIGVYQKAIDTYKSLLDADRWGNLFFDASLYKLGWSYYKINNFAEAISAFVYLLDDIKTLEETDVKILDRTIADLKKEALDYVAISFSEFGGAEKAKEFFEAIGEREYSITVFHKIGDVFYGQDRFPEAIKAYETLLELYPFYERAPQIQMQIVKCHERQWNYAEANQARETLVRNYRPEGSWLKKVKEKQVRKETLMLVEEALFKMGVYHQKRAIEGIDSTKEYSLAIDSYKELLQYFPDSPNSYKVNFYLAECLYESGDYAAAAIEYQKTIENYKDTEYLEDAAYNRILSFDQLLQESSDALPDTFFLRNLFGETDTLALAVTVQHPVQMKLIRACNDFAHLLPKSNKVPQVLSKEAEIFYNLGRYDLARKVYLKIWQDYGKSEYAQKALLMIAQCYFSKGEFSQAEEWYTKVTTALSDTCEIAQKALKMRASSGFKLAESLKEKGDTVAAAQKFEEIALGYSDLKVGERAVFEAVLLYELLNKKDRAAYILEKFASAYPLSDLIDEALMKAAALRKQLHQWELALPNYLKLIEGNSSPETASLAVFFAGLCYKNLKNWKQAEETFKKYVTLYPNDNCDRYVEALFRIGEAHFELGNYDDALQSFTRAVNAHDSIKNSGGEVTDYYAANAKFMMGEIHYQKYAQIDLVPPFEANVKRKRRAFNTVIKDCAEAAKYGVAEWTTAASYRIGTAFEEFSRALLASPRPPGLSPEELTDYESNLKQVALPMQKKALEAYQTNIAKADEHGIDNMWIQKSRERLNSLKAELSREQFSEGTE